MSIEKNKTVLRRAVASFSPDTLETYLQLYHADAQLHYLPPDLPQGVEGARLFYRKFLSAFPDARLVLEDFVAEADSVAARYSVEATGPRSVRSADSSTTSGRGRRPVPGHRRRGCLDRPRRRTVRHG